jgi:hypothetical protein
MTFLELISSPEFLRSMALEDKKKRINSKQLIVYHSHFSKVRFCVFLGIMELEKPRPCK